MADLRPAATFVDLPPELRIDIYRLAGSVTIHECVWCHRLISGDRVREHLIDDAMLDDGTTGPVMFLEPSVDCCYDNLDGFGKPAMCVTMPQQPTTAFWVNRRSDLILRAASAKQAPLVTTHPDQPKKKRKRQPRVREGRICGTLCNRIKHATEHRKVNCSPPVITKVSKHIRADTLPIFYGAHSFIFALFDYDTDSPSIIKWLDTIGKTSASLLRDLIIVCRKKQDVLHVEKQLVPEMRMRGVRIDEDVVSTRRIVQPFCFCELHMLGAAYAGIRKSVVRHFG